VPTARRPEQHFGNGISWVLSHNDGYAFINPYLTI